MQLKFPLKHPVHKGFDSLKKKNSTKLTFACHFFSSAATVLILRRLTPRLYRWLISSPRRVWTKKKKKASTGIKMIRWSGGCACKRSIEDVREFPSHLTKLKKHTNKSYGTKSEGHLPHVTQNWIWKSISFPVNHFFVFYPLSVDRVREVKSRNLIFVFFSAKQRTLDGFISAEDKQTKAVQGKFSTGQNSILAKSSCWN